MKNLNKTTTDGVSDLNFNKTTSTTTDAVSDLNFSKTTTTDGVSDLNFSDRLAAWATYKGTVVPYNEQARQAQRRRNKLLEDKEDSPTFSPKPRSDDKEKSKKEDKEVEKKEL